MKNIRIVFLLHAPFNKRDFERYGIRLLQNEQFEVEAWDFTPFLFPKVFKNYIPSDACNFNGLKVFKEKREALESLKKLDKCDVVIPMLGTDYNSYKVFKILSQKNIFYGFSLQTMVPTAVKQMSVVDKIIKIAGSLASIVYSKIPKNLIGIKNPNFILVGGEKSIGGTRYKKKTEIIWTHALDYDLYLQPNDQVDTGCIREPYIVFIDEYYPFHMDYLYFKTPPKINPNEYYSKLVSFFSFIEQIENCKVVVAAHPHSKYENHPDYFQNRVIIKGRTIDLVKHSKFVIMHSSTSINFAVLFKKPVLFIKMNLIEKWFGPSIDLMASFFEKKAICLDNIIDKSDIRMKLEINTECYDRYKEAYIKRINTPEKKSWLIFSDYLKEKFN